MQNDRYGNTLSTASAAARDAYVAGVDLALAGQTGAVEAFDAAIAADDNFALGYAGKARAAQMIADMATAQTAIAAAKEAAGRTALSSREKAHVAGMDHLVAGRGADAFALMAAHSEDYPTDVLMIQPCTSVFGLIGFSGREGREAEQLAFLTRLERYYDDDWWFNMAYAFAQCEAGRVQRSIDLIERSIAKNPQNAHGAHVRAHIYYENAESDAGYRYISEWRKGYAKEAPLHCHISWHVALWAMEAGDAQTAWQVVEADVMPGQAWGPPLNVLTDAASFLMRAELAGGERRDDLWRQVSDYATRFFPNTGIAFADVHAALAHALAGDTDALEKIIAEARGPVASMVSAMSESFRAFARQDWQAAIDNLTPVMADHERIGGSRAQRDLLEFMYLGALLRLGRSAEAKRLLQMRRPMRHGVAPVSGFA